jgi:hypothetical protein
MNLSSLVRPPLVWLVAAELALLAIIGSVAWHVWQQRIVPLASAAAPLVAAPLPSARPRQAGSASPPTASPSASVPHAAPTPGVRTDADFLSRQMAELNRAEVTFEYLEWRVTSAIVDGIQHYVTTVVLPSIERAEKGGR